MYSNDLKLVAINLYSKFHNLRHVASLLNIGKSTIHRWLHCHKIINKPDIDRILLFIKRSLIKNKFITLSSLRNKLHSSFGSFYSLSFIHTLIVKKLKFSYKKITKKIYSSSIAKLHKLQYIFNNKIKSINKDKIISIDESFFHQNISCNYGWSSIGKPIFHFSKANPVKYSLIMAITNKRVIDYQIIRNKNFNLVIFKDFLSKLISQFSDHYFLMDNISFHRSKEIVQLVHKSNNHILFIPPYSPQYNPIEEVFSFIKNKLKRSTHNKYKIINGIIKTIRMKHLKNYYNHSFLNH